MCPTPDFISLMAVSPRDVFDAIFYLSGAKLHIIIETAKNNIEKVSKPTVCTILIINILTLVSVNIVASYNANARLFP